MSGLSRSQGPFGWGLGRGLVLTADLQPVTRCGESGPWSGRSQDKSSRALWPQPLGWGSHLGSLARTFLLQMSTQKGEGGWALSVLVSIKPQTPQKQETSLLYLIEYLYHWKQEYISNIQVYSFLKCSKASFTHRRKLSNPGVIWT